MTAAREFDGRVAFITGAAHGQGRATALALAKAGARIAAFDVAKQLLRDVACGVAVDAEPHPARAFLSRVRRASISRIGRGSTGSRWRARTSA